MFIISVKIKTPNMDDLQKGQNIEDAPEEIAETLNQKENP